jgi:hypothetical protein
VARFTVEVATLKSVTSQQQLRAQREGEVHSLISEDNTEMIAVKKSNIPAYLQSSEFFLSLNDEDDGLLSFPSSALKQNTMVHSAADVVHLLSTLRFWGVKDVPPTIVEYCIGANDESLEAAVAPFIDYFPYLRTLLHINEVRGYKKMEAAIRSHEQAIVEYIYNKQHYIPGHGCDCAAECGSLECLKFLVSKGGTLTLSTAVTAAHHGQLECLAYILSKGISDKQVCTAAALNGHLHCLKYAHEHGCEIDKAALTGAIANGHFTCFKYVHEHGAELSDSTMRLIAEHNQQRCLQYALDNGCLWSPTVPQVCAGKGHLGLLKFAFENGCPWEESTCAAAAGAGQLKCLQYAHEHGCPWDESTCVAAAREGHFECLRYAVQAGCPAGHNTMDAAAGGGSVEAILFLQTLNKK